MSFPTTTRAMIVARAKQGFGDGLDVTPYDQDILKNGYRTDCSGYVSRCLGLTSDVGNGFWGGLNTVTLPLCLTPMDINSLVQGDICGELGPGTAGDNGHVYIFDQWFNSDPNNNDFYCWEQFGGNDGPSHTLRTWPYPDVCQGYRYKYLVPPTVQPVFDAKENDMKVIGYRDASGKVQPSKFLLFSNGNMHHIVDPESLAAYEAQLGPEITVSFQEFQALQAHL